MLSIITDYIHTYCSVYCRRFSHCLRRYTELSSYDALNMFVQASLPRLVQRLSDLSSVINF